MSPPESSRVARLILIGILVLSGFIQFTVVSRTEVNAPLRSDARIYFSHAYNLKNFGVYSGEATWAKDAVPHLPSPDALVTPGYPLFLLALGNPEPNLGYLRRVSFAQAGLGVLSVLLMFLISRRFLGEPWALGAALLTALSPHLAVMSTYLLTESLFIFLLLASVQASLLALETRRAWAIVMAGILWGMCSLVRPTTQFLPALLLVAALAVPQLRGHSRVAALAFACFLAVQAPWRWAAHSLPPDPGQPSLMVNFLNLGSYPNFMFEGRPESYGSPYKFDPSIEAIRKDLPSVLGDIGNHFRQEPLKYANWYLLGKPGFFLSWSNIDGFGDIFVYPVNRSPYLDSHGFALARVLMLLLHWPLMLLGIHGALVVFLRPAWAGLTPAARLAAGLVSLVFAYALAFHMIGAPLPRYGIPFRLLLYPLALLAVKAMIVRKRLPP